MIFPKNNLIAIKIKICFWNELIIIAISDQFLSK